MRARLSTALRRVGRRQHGAALVVGMILLLLMSVASLTALKTIKTDERLASNLQDRYLAFQAAESALRAGEELLEQASLPAFDGSGGLYPFSASEERDPRTELLEPGNGRAYGTTPHDVSQPPLYMIEEMEAGVERGASLLVGVRYGNERRACYRISALGFGGSKETQVLLQTTFRR